MIAMLRRFDLDEEDLDLLRAEGVKSPNDFRRIKSVDRLNLPSVTREKVRDLVSNLPTQGNADLEGGGAMGKMRRSLGRMFGAARESLAGYLPSTPDKGAASVTAAPTPSSRALKPKGMNFSRESRTDATTYDSGITKTSKSQKGANRKLSKAQLGKSAAEPNGGAAVGSNVLSSAAALVQALGGMLSPARRAPQRPDDEACAAPPDAALQVDMPFQGGKRQKQSNMIEVLGLPSQQAGAARAGKGQGATRRGGGAGKARRLTGAGNTAVKVKDEVEVKMSLRAKQTKKGFYNERNLAHLAWCKGRGTRLDPFVID